MMAGDKTNGGVESISSLPDVILQHILCFIPTKSGIRTSLLSKRWRHVWCGTPSLSFDTRIVTAASINETLDRYTVLKMMSFHLEIRTRHNVPHIDINKWIEFAMSRNVEKLSLNFDKYNIPDSFYINSSVKQLTIDLNSADIMIPRCSVSWKSLKKLSLRYCSLSVESMAEILSGCPVLGSLSLDHCKQPEVLDLSQSLLLRTLEVVCDGWVPGPTHILAPHIHCLILTIPQLPCTLLDVSSLSEAHLDLSFSQFEISFKADDLQTMGINMLEKLQDVEKLSFGANFFQIFLIAERRGVPLPMLKVKTLTLKTALYRYLIPGIKRIIQNSPDLKKLTYHTRDCNPIYIPEEDLDYYLYLQGTCLKSQSHSTWLFHETCV